MYSYITALVCVICANIFITCCCKQQHANYPGAMDRSIAIVSTKVLITNINITREVDYGVCAVCVHRQVIVQVYTPLLRNIYLHHCIGLFVPIDPSSAVVGTKVAITQGPTPTPSPIISPVANTTCSVLKNLAENADYFKCTSDTTPPCDTVYCTEELGNNNNNSNGSHSISAIDHAPR